LKLIKYKNKYVLYDEDGKVVFITSDKRIIDYYLKNNKNN